MHSFPSCKIHQQSSFQSLLLVTDLQHAMRANTTRNFRPNLSFIISPLYVYKNERGKQWKRFFQNKYHKCIHATSLLPGRVFFWKRLGTQFWHVFDKTPPIWSLFFVFSFIMSSFHCLMTLARSILSLERCTSCVFPCSSNRKYVFIIADSWAVNLNS